MHLAEILAARGELMQDVDFPVAAKEALRDSQLCVTTCVSRRNTIRDKRAAVVAELDDWQQLREAGRLIKERALRHLDVHLEALERSVTEAGGHVHWAADGAEANRNRR